MDRTTLLRRTSLWITTIMMSLFGLTGIVSAQSASITNTGPDSTNRIISTVDNSCRINNTTDVDVSNVNQQNASTGDAMVGGENMVFWTGWPALNPEKAQAQGTSFADWWSSVDNWMNTHGDESKWVGPSDNLGWAPSDSSWESLNPTLWQAHGQSFANWDAQAVGFLNSNAPSMMLTWGGGNTTGGDATTGDATNVNTTTTNISIINPHINLAAVGASNPCGFTATPGVPSGGGMGGGMGGGSYVTATKHYAPARSYGGYGGGSGGAYYAPTSYAKPAPKKVSAPIYQAPATPVKPVTPPPAGGSGGGAPSGNTISNTGPDSHNTIVASTSNCVTVTNTNTVGVTNVNNQTASSGNATVSNNTTGGSSGTGDASNANGAGTGVGVGN